MKNDRLFQMVYILLEKGSVTAPELASTLEVSVRTVYRDVEALSMAGVPVYASQGKGGGISLMPNYSFDKALLSDDEQNQILFAIQSLQATDQPVGALLKKLGGMFQKQNVSWIEADFSRWGMGRVDNEKFERLKTAILEKRVLEILYCSTSGETAKRSILPFKLIFKDKSWYLQAFCKKADDYRLFKVNQSWSWRSQTSALSSRSTTRRRWSSTCYQSARLPPSGSDSRPRSPSACTTSSTAGR